MKKPTRKTAPEKKPALEKRATPTDPGNSPLLEHAADQQVLAAAMPFNSGKKAEYGYRAAVNPVSGATTEMPSITAGAATLSEGNDTGKTGPAATEPVAPSGELGRARVNSSGRWLTTNQGVAVADNQSSLKAGLRGPTLLEDFILREKVTHFDHERIPERIVHARGS